MLLQQILSFHLVLLVNTFQFSLVFLGYFLLHLVIVLSFLIDGLLNLFLLPDDLQHPAPQLVDTHLNLMHLFPLLLQPVFQLVIIETAGGRLFLRMHGFPHGLDFGIDTTAEIKQIFLLLDTFLHHPYLPLDLLADLRLVNHAIDSKLLIETICYKHQWKLHFLRIIVQRTQLSTGFSAAAEALAGYSLKLNSMLLFFVCFRGVIAVAPFRFEKV